MDKMTDEMAQLNSGKDYETSNKLDIKVKYIIEQKDKQIQEL